MPNWSNVYDEFIAGLFLSMFLALVTIMIKLAMKFSFRRFVVSVVRDAITQCSRNNKISHLNALRDMDKRIQARKDREHGK
jgi:hypothetical protein